MPAETRREGTVARGGPAYDYLLVVGPGRSGTTFLYKLLNGRPGFESPEIKEGYYYRSPRRCDKALRRIQDAPAPAILLDVANLAWRDRSLPGGVDGLRGRGHRVLLVVLLREHRARAVSMLAFRRSRGMPLAFLGRATLERAVVRDSLTAEDLDKLFGLGVDVLIVDFPALVGRTATVLDVLADLCGTPRIERAGGGPVNPAERARSVWLALAGKLAAVVLRGIGCRRLLQRLKDSPRVRRVFFRPGGADNNRYRLGAAVDDLLARRFEACRRTIDDASERLAAGVWLKRAGRRTGQRRRASSEHQNPSPHERCIVASAAGSSTAAQVRRRTPTSTDPATSSSR